MILCCAGVLQSLFLSFYFFSFKTARKFEQVIVGLIFLAVSLRLIKSLGWFYFDVNHPMFLNLGFVAHGFIAPLLVFYLDHRLSTPRIWKKLLLFVPPLLLLGASPFITLSNFWYQGGYKWLLYATLFYLLWAGFLLIKNRKVSGTNFSWYRDLFLGISLFCLLYFTNYVLGLNRYITGPIVYSLAIYYISFVVFRKQHFFQSEKKKKYQNIKLSDEQTQEFMDRVKGAMDDQLYLNSDFSLTMLSESTSIPKHLLSHLFNEVISQSFTDFTNSYRIEAAKVKLKDPAFSNLKIAAIAYECGFNSISAFNAAFKKKEEVSPSVFRNGE
ncbi:MAG: hypothetical protein Tsb0034_22000 [Ekhidna sp.]